jgi:hypothetical protein
MGIFPQSCTVETHDPERGALMQIIVGLLTRDGGVVERPARLRSNLWGA